VSQPPINSNGPKALSDEHRWKQLARWHVDGYYTLQTADTGDVPVRLFLTHELLTSAEDNLYRQVVNATRFPGVRMVVITPDVHYGYGVPVGCVLITDYESGAIAMGPVGYDIGCGMMSAKSTVPADAAMPEKRLQFNRAVMERVAMGAGGKSHRFRNLSEDEFAELVRGGAEHTMSRNMARLSIAAALNATAFLSMMIGKFPGAAKASPNEGCISSAVSAAAITSSSFSAK
jgi:tRNA-splicing ligase RtcB (3'-phosphate/5'-hydroxy nucleic acid ligase)